MLADQLVLDADGDVHEGEGVQLGQHHVEPLHHLLPSGNYYDINLGLLVGKIIPNCLRKNVCFNHENPLNKWAVYTRTGIVEKSASCVAQNLQLLTIRCERVELGTVR
jgi:hypothetical protein